MKALWCLLVHAAASRLSPAPVPNAGPPVQESAPSAGTPFGTLLPFVPLGMESVMFIDFSSGGLPEQLRPQAAKEEWPAAGPELLEELRKRSRSLRGIFAGRRFAMRGFGGGDFEGVEIYESANDLPVLAGLFPEGGGWKKEIVAGCDAYSGPAQQEGPLETWVAAPSKRILLIATRRGMLEESLRRKGPDADALFGALRWKRGADWTSPIVIVRRYDPSNEADAYSPLNTKAKGFAPVTRGFKIDGLHLEYRPAESPGFRAWVRTEDPESARRYFEELLYARPAVAGFTPDPLAAPLAASPSAPGEILLDGKFPDRVRPLIPLVLFQAFGLNIFI